MRKFFWCLFKWFKNYPHSEDLDNLVRKCIWLIENCEGVSVTIDQYKIYITSASTKIELWNANKFYAWLKHGYVNGRHFGNVSASNKVMWDFKECLKKHGHDIYVKEQEIDISDVKC